ncbi:MAG TPA: hypothetical protein VEQ59_03480 [Polyangiaceae bacterium]|nr:hypothetical protein [Polyangiaceae bacterium]
MDTRATLESLKSVRGVARSSQDGEALASAGELDADTLCAVAAVSADALLQVGELLAAGSLERWYFVSEDSTYYVSERGRERLVAIGEPVRNAESTAKALHGAR